MKRKTEYLNFRIKSEDKKVLVILAEAHEMTLSEYIRYLLHKDPRVEKIYLEQVNARLVELMEDNKKKLERLTADDFLELTDE